jgi:hypothetical protein
MQFDMKRPCKDCPFLKGTTMVLNAGRMTDIAQSLADDHNVFPCHKTTNATRDDEGDEGAGYAYDGTEQACMGALAFTLREHGMLPVLARIACLQGQLTVDTLRANFAVIEQAEGWETY